MTFQKAKPDLAQDVQVIVRALTVNTSSMLKGKLRSSLKQQTYLIFSSFSDPN